MTTIYAINIVIFIIVLINRPNYNRMDFQHSVSIRVF